MKVRRTALSLHNWMGLLVGIQIVFWFVGGMVMTILPLDLVRGERSMTEQMAEGQSTAVLARTLGKINVADARSVNLRRVADIQVLEVGDSEGGRRIYDIETASLLSPINSDMATKVALNDFQYRDTDYRSATVQSTEWITEEPGDFRRELPVWRINLDDPDGTRIYVSPDSGRVLARRNDYWRVFDFFWMLHIMDYDEREDFNNPLLIITTVTSTLFVLTGVVLLYYRFWPWRRRRRSA